MKILFYDLETTGTKYWENGIYQIGGLICIDNEIKEEFNFKLKPFENKIIEDAALQVGGITKEILLTYVEPKEIYKNLVTTLNKYVDKFNKKDKFYLAGYNNASFDNQFFRQFFLDNGDKYFGSFFWSNTLDILILATQLLLNKRTIMPDFKLKSVASALDLTFDAEKLHDAIYDIKLTKMIYDKINEINEAKK